MHALSTGVSGLWIDHLLRFFCWTRSSAEGTSIEAPRGWGVGEVPLPAKELFEFIAQMKCFVNILVHRKGEQML